jgi:hypothetical protein
VVALAACGSSSMKTVDGSPMGSDADAGPDANIPPGWTTLIDGHWQLAPAGQNGDEIYWCHRMKVTQDMWISGFRALAPPGTHHAILTIDPTTPQTGEFGAPYCNSTVGFDTNDRLVYASGLSTNDLVFPPGIAVHLTAGEYITLNLHLLNSGDTSKMDTSGVLVQTVDASQVQHEIDATFAGTRSIDIPDDGTDHYVVGGCSAPQDWHVFAVWPHMHKFGVHGKLLATTSANVTTTVLDQPFDFTAEKTYPMNETVIHMGDAITARCDYIVPTQTCTYPAGQCTYGSCAPDGFCHVSYGESAGGEMCYVAMYKYPAGDVPPYGCHASQ